MSSTLFFICFLIFVTFVMLFDLGIFSKKKQDEISYKEAGFWSLVWVLLSLSFYFFIKNQGAYIHGINSLEKLQEIKFLYFNSLTFNSLDEGISKLQNTMALEYLTGYLVEYSLSADNIFVFILLFNSFGVREKHYKKVLVWGIVGSIILRFVFIFLGAALLQKFEWILYVFGAFLVYTGIKILFEKEEKEIKPAEHPIVKWSSKIFNVYHRNVTNRFFVQMKKSKKLFVTPLFIVMLVVAFTDVIFAIDSIPAIFSITKDPNIVFFSNVFAIMGLRSMFFFLVNIIHLFRFLKYGLGILLAFIGLKMLLHSWLDKIGFTTIHSLYVILGILAISILASFVFPEKKNQAT